LRPPDQQRRRDNKHKIQREQRSGFQRIHAKLLRNIIDGGSRHKANGIPKNFSTRRAPSKALDDVVCECCELTGFNRA
jgi:hypothetical protein